MKLLSVILLLNVISATAFATGSPLEKLPFNIIIGQTKNSEIENRGVCKKEIQVSPNHFRCEVYSMLGGKFTVFSSQNEIVNEVLFDGSVNEVFPQSWQNLGLKLGDYKESETTRIPSNPGTLEADFLTIIQDNGAENISTQTSANGTQNTIISFDVGMNHFDATFGKMYWESRGVHSEYGLINVNVTEQF